MFENKFIKSFKPYKVAKNSSKNLIPSSSIGTNPQSNHQKKYLMPLRSFLKKKS